VPATQTKQPSLTVTPSTGQKEFVLIILVGETLHQETTLIHSFGAALTALCSSLNLLSTGPCFSGDVTLIAIKEV